MTARNGARVKSRRADPKPALPAVPYSLDSEHGVLGCLLNEHDLREKHLDGIIAGDFFAEENSKLFNVIVERHHRGESLALDVLARSGADIGHLADCQNHALEPRFLSMLATVKNDTARRARLAEIEIEAKRIIDDPDYLTGPAKGLKARDAIDLVNDVELIEPPILVDRLLHRGGMLLIGAASKSFKSWGLIDLSIAVANGSSWWGLRCTKGTVLYADFELKPFFWRKRAVEISQERALDLNGIRVLNCRGHRACDALAAIEREAKETSFDLIVADPIYSFLDGRDENSAGDVGQVMRQLGSLSETTGAALALSHHFAKGNASGKDSQDRFSGSGVFARFPDCLLTMTRHEEDGAFVIDSTIRNFAPVPSWVMRWQHPLMVRDGQLDPAKLKKPPGAFEAKYCVEQLVEALGSESLTFGKLVDKAKDAFGMSKATTDRLLKQGIEAGTIEKINLFYRAVSRVSRP